MHAKGSARLLALSLAQCACHVGEDFELLDDAWRQAGRLLPTHPHLQALPRWSQPAQPPSRCGIRTAPRPQQQRSTLQAAGLAQGALEQRPQHDAALLPAFSGWVDTVAARATGHGPARAARCAVTANPLDGLPLKPVRTRPAAGRSTHFASLHSGHTVAA